MELLANPFKRAILEGRPQIGCWSSLFSNFTVEILAGAGFDWLLLDMEHSPNEVGLVLGQLQAMAGGPAHAVVRPPWNDAVIIKRLLDVGAQSFLIPYVQTEAEARAAVAATRYPPRGIRGVAMSMRANRFGLVADYHRHCEAELCVLVQIETRLGLTNLEAIAAVEGVDGIFIGPSDLSAALGHLGNAGHPEVQGAIEDAIARIGAAGKAPGILTPDETLARRYLELGCLFTAVGSDQGLLTRGSRELAARFRQGPR